jgi:hypothetical protein
MTIVRTAHLVASIIGLLATASASADAVRPAFGPKEYARGTGAPVAVTETFPVCRPERAFRLRVLNGPGGQPRVSAATITLDGVEIVTERNLNAAVALVERRVRLRPSSTVGIRLDGLPGGVLSVAIVSDTGCLEIAITSPASGASVPAGSLVVRGTVRGAAEIGVSVNGVRAAVHEEAFAAIVPVAPAETELAAVATVPGGSTAEARQPLVVTEVLELPPLLRALPEGGPAPLTARFSLLALSAVDEIALDARGRGIVDFRGPTLDEVSIVYDAPGLYYPAVSVTGGGEVRTAATVLHVLDGAATDARLQARWRAMKDALRRGDIDGAMEAVATSVRVDYRELFGALTIPLAQIDLVLGDLTLVSLDADAAQYKMIRMEDGLRMSYLVQFVRDADGIWRLKFL